MLNPHRQRAIDKAKAELIYAKDLQLRRLAQEIIVERSQEDVRQILAGEPARARETIFTGARFRPG